MAKLVDNERLAKLAKALDQRAKAAVAAEQEARENAIAQEVEDRNDAIEEAVTFENGITTVNSLGGIGAGVSLDGKTAVEILDMLLFPYVKQTVGNVARTPNATLLEKGNDQVITKVQAVVTKKSKPIVKVELLKGSEVIAIKEGDDVKNGGTIVFDGLSVAVPSTNVVLKVKATDENGSEVSADTAGWTFVYPYFYGICEAGATIDEALVEGLTKDVQNKGNKTYSYTTNNQCAVVAFPKANGVLKSALDPNAFENIGAFTRHEVTITGLDGTAQAYYVYVSGAFTGSGFKYTFKH
jgi:hypothetical protein